MCHIVMSTTYIELIMLNFLSINYMCMLCERIVIYQCTCVFVHDYGILYYDILYLYDI